MGLRTRGRYIKPTPASGNAARLLKGQIKRAHGARGYEVMREAKRR
jgi:ribosomal protein L35AE/L33A